MISLGNAELRALARLGLKRRSKQVHDLDDYLDVEGMTDEDNH